jgi:hypothetical protein
MDYSVTLRSPPSLVATADANSGHETGLQTKPVSLLHSSAGTPARVFWW